MEEVEEVGGVSIVQGVQGVQGAALMPPLGTWVGESSETVGPPRGGGFTQNMSSVEYASHCPSAPRLLDRCNSSGVKSIEK